MSPYTKQFYKEISSAKKVEDWALKMLSDRFQGLKHCELRESSGDLIDEIGQLIEVKYDKKSKDTGNVALEVSAYGMPKGIATTKAKYYFIVCKGYDFYSGKWIGCLINTNILRALTRELKSIFGGDNDATEIKLAPVTFLIENAEKIYILKN